MYIKLLIYKHMKYLKRYEKFINDVINNVDYNINKNITIVEKQVLNDFSVSFWDLSLNSSIFTEEEKCFIKENLMSVKVNLINEGWLSDQLVGVWNKAKEKGGEILNKIKNKIIIIKNYLVKLITDISKFIISMFNSIGKTILTKSNELKEKNKDNFEQIVKSKFNENKPDNDKLNNEVKQLKSTIEYITSSLKKLKHKLMS